MNINRRNFIQKVSIAAVAALSLNSVDKISAQILKRDDFFPIPPESASDPLNFLTSGHFEQFINTPIRVQAGAKGIVQLQLIEVKNLIHSVNSKRGYRGESFSLLFQTVKRTKLTQDTYVVSHDALGEFSLFLVPTGLRGIRYEAIINRLTS